jgi:hypothetical protein
MKPAHLLLAVTFFVGLIACNSQQVVSIEPTQTETAQVDFWDELLARSPLDVNGNPLALTDPSPIDGTYGRLADIPPQWWRCYRCAEYRPSGGLWHMQLDRGVVRILYEMNNWHTVAAFRVEGDRLFLSNDLVCDEEGEYQWMLSDGSLQLSVIDDPCNFDLRGRNLSTGTWQLCPEDRNAAGAPLGCANRIILRPLDEKDLPVMVTVYAGDIRTSDNRPELIVRANKEDSPPPQGVQISFSEDTQPYGINRILWWGGNWIEARSDLDATAIGVQFYGTNTIGWASVFFDGNEVWRGDVSAIWNHHGSYGGYIEISGFEPGEHVIRVESVAGDYRPLTIAVFGYGKTGVAE